MLNSLFQITASAVQPLPLYLNPSYSLTSSTTAAPCASSRVTLAPAPKKRDPMKAIVSGALAGGIEVCMTYPTEYIKTQLQLFEKNAKMGPIGLVKHTIKEEGFLALYRGLSPLLVFSVPKVAARFLGFETLRNSMMAEDGTLSAGRTLLAGLGAGAFEAIVAVTPMETIKVRFIHDQVSRAPADRKYKGLVHGIKTIVAEQGISGTYKGLTATIMKQGSNQAIRWLVFTRVKTYFAGGNDYSKLNVFHTIAAGVLAGAASVYGNTPIDVIKTRMQGLEASKYKNTWDCAKSVYVNEGLAAFYKGAVPRMTRVCLDVAIVMVLYEQINKILDTVWKTD